MRGWVRRLRGFIGAGVIWGAIWSALGGVFGIVLGVTGGVVPFDASVVLSLAAGMGIFGLIAGTSFGMLLTATQGRKALTEVSTVGAMGVGFAAGFLAPVGLAAVGAASGPIAVFLTLSTVMGVAGASVAAFTLEVARRNDREELPPARATTQLPPEIG